MQYVEKASSRLLVSGTLEVQGVLSGTNGIGGNSRALATISYKDIVAPLLQLAKSLLQQWPLWQHILTPTLWWTLATSSIPDWAAHCNHHLIPQRSFSQSRLPLPFCSPHSIPCLLGLLVLYSTLLSGGCLLGTTFPMFRSSPLLFPVWILPFPGCTAVNHNSSIIWVVGRLSFKRK